MDLGTFSLSLTVKDLAASRAFYEKLGFTVFDGNQDQNWLIMSNGDTKIGLFQGMFEKNVLTFITPDVRGVQKHLKTEGIELITEADESTEGPASLTLADPDGNPILFDQHDEAYMANVAKRQQMQQAAWIDLTVPDAEHVRDFYQAVIGWQPEPVSMGDYDDYNMTKNGKPITGVCHKKGMNADIPSQWMIYFYVEDLDKAIEAVKVRGGTVIKAPVGDENGRYAIIEDPAGAVCALMG